MLLVWINRIPFIIPQRATNPSLVVDGAIPKRMVFIVVLDEVWLIPHPTKNNELRIVTKPMTGGERRRRLGPSNDFVI